MKKHLNSIITGVMITLISSAIIGGLWLYTDYKITKEKQALINAESAKNKAYTNRLYRVTIKRLNTVDSKIYSMDTSNIKQHEDLIHSVNQLEYAVIKHNKNVKETLDEIKKYNFITGN